MTTVINGQVAPTNAGLFLLDTPFLIHSQRSYERLLGQMATHGAADVAARNIEGYLAELDAVLAERAVPEAA